MPKQLLAVAHTENKVASFYASYMGKQKDTAGCYFTSKTHEVKSATTKV